ncbi:cyclic pyranopterin phosphate synthase [Methylomagnum ishizawai]|uniref:GTP 3',8-cyclase n=1 Tax=Methylomagnum ishizawai TaxID=1760988 RepID=A0A1Y6D6E0_9GAMM|nr:GTP 3',8-cyclase MoaA [Methylomagnum ishizawai]SMF95475.1 cyclic pyranopterin phosphate synthase [Methylomagnum ishizawai]
MTMNANPLIDRYGRRVHYLRVSITDRCDFRCIYCMGEEMEFLPRAQILTLEEIAAVCRAFVALGADKIRITGGEPLVRKGAVDLMRDIGGLPGLRELALTTNGSQLEGCAADLKAAGVKRINVSLDSLDAGRFRQMTRIGDLGRVLRGIDAALEQDFDKVKLNTVVLKGRNHDEVCDLVAYAVAKRMDISFIEEMPLGVVDGHDRAEEYYSSDAIHRDLDKHFSLLPTPENTGGPSRYFRVVGTATRVGFISPHSHNFCGTCNRVRLTAEGRLLLCLGNEHSVDLKRVLRANPGDAAKLRQAIVESMHLKPERHHFDLKAEPVIFRHMNATGG